MDVFMGYILSLLGFGDMTAAQVAMEPQLQCDVIYNTATGETTMTCREGIGPPPRRPGQGGSVDPNG